MPTTLTVYANTSAVDQDRVAQPSNYIQLDLNNDKLIWSAGSAAVADGQDTPTTAELNEAATVIQVTDVEVDKLFLLDVSNVGFELKEIDLAGSTNTRFVINFSFDNATASEPTLEAWDDSTHTTTNLNVLGSGSPTNSMIKAVLTTLSSPGLNWVGTPIAGAVDPYILKLNGGSGAFGSAAEVYVNLKVVIPGNFTTAFSEQPVLSVRFTFV